MSNKDMPAWEHKAVDAILADLMDRRGIKNGFNDIDDDVWTEIKETMASIIREAALAELEGRELNKQTGGGCE